MACERGTSPQTHQDVRDPRRVFGRVTQAHLAETLAVAHGDEVADLIGARGRSGGQHEGHGGGHPPHGSTSSGSTATPAAVPVAAASTTAGGPATSRPPPADSSTARVLYK